MKVQIAESLRDRIPAGATLFVIAREPGGAPVPVAAEKLSASQWPVEVRLDDADSLMPTGKLSAQREVELVARVSASGNAMPQAGDLESAPVRVALPGKGPVELRIGHARE